ncbi:MAG TPA: protease modulator HflK, partial [Rhodoferax sp.]
MKFQLPTFSSALLPRRLQGMFNLNDPRWGRSDDKPSEGKAGDEQRPQSPDSEPSRGEDRPSRGSANQGPPDLDELWR